MGRISKRHSGNPNAVTLPAASAGAAARCFKAGIYARLSADLEKRAGRQNAGSQENARLQSESLESQIEIARRFVEEWNQRNHDRIEVVGCYTDLGKTGTNFNRDGFKRLMQDVRLGEINCVIVKDLSRFGRNYLEAGNYIEKIFPFLGVRFIAVADGYDTGAGGNDAGQMVSEIKNLVNDMYAKDTSVKVRSSLAQRRKEGSYVGGPAPYGYRTEWAGRLRKLVPDENTADIVRYIYQKFIETESYTAVTDELNTRRINPPAVYRETGEVCCSPETDFKGWDKSGVERVIKSETYTGRLVQGKTSITARDEKNRIHKPENEWMVKQDAHEPLIGIEIAQEAARVRKKLQERKESHGHPTQGCPIGENIFDKVLYCGVCGRKMTRHSYVKRYENGTRKRMGGYFCLNGGSTKTDVCPSSNRISNIELTDILSFLLETELAANLKKQKAYVEAAKEIVREKKAELERSLRSTAHAKERLEREESDKYAAYRSGGLSQREYIAYRMQKEDRIRELETKQCQFREQISGLERDGEAYLKAVRALLKWKKSASSKNGQVLTKELIETLIEKIYVYPGKRVEVLFTYNDALLEKAGRSSGSVTLPDMSGGSVHGIGEDGGME